MSFIGIDQFICITPAGAPDTAELLRLRLSRSIPTERIQEFLPPYPGDTQPRLTDFGAARMDGQETLTHTAGVIGTLDYASPEALAGRRADARADVFGLGMTLFFAATGRLPPRPAPHLPAIDDPPSLRSGSTSDDGHHPAKVRAEVPPWLDAIIARATPKLG